MTLDTDWGYLLAQQFLDASVSCGATCTNRQVVPPGFAPTGGCMGDGDCACRLTASVLEGITGTKCTMVRTARIELILEVCGPVPDDTTGNIDPVKASGIARDQSILRWQIIAGIVKAAKAGQLCGGSCTDGIPGAGNCADFTAGGWEAVQTEGTCLRYKMTWSYAKVMA